MNARISALRKGMFFYYHFGNGNYRLFQRGDYCPRSKSYLCEDVHTREVYVFSRNRLVDRICPYE